MTLELSTDNRKRDRVDSECTRVNSPDSKRIRFDLGDSVHYSSELILISDEPVPSPANHSELDSALDELEDSVLDSPEVKRLQHDLFDDMLDDSDDAADLEPAIQGLDSVIRSFEEEILVPPPCSIQMTTQAAESQPELGYLFEASDDDLGLPPAFSMEEEEFLAADFTPAEPDASGLGDVVDFELQIPSYDSFGFEISAESETNSNIGAEFVSLGGLFEYEDGGYRPDDYTEVSWRSESLPAL